MRGFSRRSWCVGLAAMVVAVGSAGAVSAQAVVEGTWRSGNASEIVIVPCGGAFCGVISKPYVSPEELARYGDAETAMQAFRDENNSDASLRDRPLLGLTILNVKAGRNADVFDGEVYNPSDGKTYSGSITMKGTNSMALKGCALFVFCQEETWTRVQ